MTSKIWTPGIVIDSAWLQDVDTVVYKGVIPTGTTTIRTLQSKLSDFISVKDYGAVGDNVADDTLAIQAALTAANSAGGGTVYFSPGTYKITTPLLMYGETTIRGSGENSCIIRKTTNTVGSGTSRARAGTVTDNYAIDSIISIWHTDGVVGTQYAYRSKISDITLKGNNTNTYGIFAPRISSSAFNNIVVINVATAYYTNDTWMTKFDRFTAQAVSRGWKYADDASGVGTGTSNIFNDCWVNFDNSVNQPIIGFDFFGLTYSSTISCAVDNATATDNSVPVCFSFNTCIGHSMIGCGTEGGRASILSAASSILSVLNMRTFQMSANAAWGTVGALFNDTSTITYIGCKFEAYSPGAGVFNQIIQNTAKQTEIDSIMPTGGNTFLSYSSSSTRTILSSGQISSLNANGTLVAFPQQATVAYSASITIDCTLGNEFVITATNGTAFTINAPTSPVTSQRISITLRNASGGALGVATWNAVFKMSAWTNPANTTSRSIDFIYNGTNWIQVTQTGVDVPN